MPDLPENDPAFLAAYLEAEKGMPAHHVRRKPAEGSLDALWQAYARSDAYRALSPSYRAVLRRHIDRMIEQGGHVPARQIAARHLRADMSGLSGHAANQRLKTWRALLGYAQREGWIDEDPSRAIERRKTQAPNKHLPWTREEVSAFRAHWPMHTAQRLAFELMHWTGCRCSDVVRLGPGMVDRDGWLTFRQQKTGGTVSVPFDRALPPFADARALAALRTAIKARPERHMTWLATRQGTARSAKAVSQWFSSATRAAGITGKTGHGLRATRAVALAEAGASVHQIAAWTGHKSLSEVQGYTLEADRKRLLSGPEGEQKVFSAHDPEQKGAASG
jgi:integrase